MAKHISLRGLYIVGNTSAIPITKRTVPSLSAKMAGYERVKNEQPYSVGKLLYLNQIKINSLASDLIESHRYCLLILPQFF